MNQDLANCLPDERPLPPPTDMSRTLFEGDRRYSALIPLVRRPWLLRTGPGDLIIRPAVARDLEAVAAMHRRCSARSLLDRYRMGGRRPSVLALHGQLQRPLSFVAAAPRGATVVALATMAIDENHGRRSARIGLLVQDNLQGHGIGRELVTQLAAAAVVCGYSELVAYPATSVVATQKLLMEIGTCRLVPDLTHRHLHLSLPASAALGLGAVRERLAS
jgi:GNAT superfamily N-acetyltransferase